MIKEVDRNKVYKLLKKYFPSYEANDPFEKILIYEEAEVEGLISYSLIYERAEINYIVTFEKYKRRGVAKKLLNKALEDMVENCCEIVTLEVEINNKPAINLYQSCGFKIEAIRKNYYQGKDAYLMSKEVEVVW